MHPGAQAEKTPDKPAYVMARSGRTVTYRELDEKSSQGAQLFRSLGLQPGDHIALCMENNEHYFQICWAAQRSGLYYTCISSRLSAARSGLHRGRLRREGLHRLEGEAGRHEGAGRGLPEARGPVPGGRLRRRIRELGGGHRRRSPRRPSTTRWRAR